MGGNAFASGPDPLSTPRMPPDVYRKVLSRCHSALADLFALVDSPIDGPGKEDYGDIDVLVALPRPRQDGKLPDEGCEDGDQRSCFMDSIRAVLGAEHVLPHPDGWAATMAIPWPTDLGSPSATSTVEEGVEKRAADARPGGDGDVDDIKEGEGQQQKPAGEHQERDQQQQRQPLHIQVDVRICPSRRRLEWALFKHAHGDFWNLAGSAVRPLGLTVDEEALWLRVPEIERFHRNRAKVRLTADPAVVLEFLGFEEKEAQEASCGEEGRFWQGPFGTTEELFEYVARCRWIWVAVERARREGDDLASADDPGEPAKKKLKANDRRRMKFRPVYRAWVEDFLPRCLAQGRFPDPTPKPDPSPSPPSNTDTAATAVERARDAVREEAFARFEGVRAEYAARLHEWHVEKQRGEILNGAIKGGVPAVEEGGPVPSHQYRASAVRALRNLLLEGDDSAQTAAAAGIPCPSIRLPDGLYDVEAAHTFVRDNWKTVAEAAWKARLIDNDARTGNSNVQQ